MSIEIRNTRITFHWNGKKYGIYIVTISITMIPTVDMYTIMDAMYAMIAMFAMFFPRAMPAMCAMFTFAVRCRSKDVRCRSIDVQCRAMFAMSCDFCDVCDVYIHTDIVHPGMSF